MKKVIHVCHPFMLISLALIGGALSAQDAEQQYRKWDIDGDDRVSKDELPELLRVNFMRVDRDADGYISLEEHLRFVGRNAQVRPGQIPENVEVHRDLAYVTNGHERQCVDLYLPKDSDGRMRPLIIWVHGGGWRAGSRLPCPALFLTQHGYAVASVGYRLSDTAIFPAQIHDCKAAVRFLRSHAKEYRLDKNRFGAWGSSAGGHLVALLGTSSHATELEGDMGIADVSSSVQGVCDYFGPTDLQKMAAQSDSNSRIDHDAPDSPESVLLGGPLQQQTDLAKKANPINYVHPECPPFLIVHGDRDPLVPLAQSQLLQAALEKAGVESRLVVVSGGGHGPFRDESQLKTVREFFDKTLAAKREQK